MTEKNGAEDGNSISSKSPWHMKWDRQQSFPFFTCCLMSQKCKICFLLYLKEIYAQFVETNVLVKHSIYHELKRTIMDLDLQITWKHPGADYKISFEVFVYCFSQPWIYPFIYVLGYYTTTFSCLLNIYSVTVLKGSRGNYIQCIIT